MNLSGSFSVSVSVSFRINYSVRFNMSFSDELEDHYPGAEKMCILMNKILNQKKKSVSFSVRYDYE